MTWLAWRCQRPALLVAFGLLAVTAVALVVARVVIEGRAAALGVGVCLTDATQQCFTGPAQPLYAGFRETFTLLRAWLVVAAPLVGVIVGAGLLAREVEQRTVLFVGTQAISRVGWWARTVAMALVPAIVGVLAVTRLAGWALEPYMALYRQERIGTLDFDISGIWPVAATVLAFALAAAFGAVLRSSLAVVVATVGVWVVLYASLSGTRYDLLPDAVESVPAASSMGSFDIDGLPQELVYRGPQGEVVEPGIAARMCGSDGVLTTCEGQEVVAQVELYYQPSSHFWPLQALQSAIVAVLASGLLVFSALRWRRVIPGGAR